MRVQVASRLWLTAALLVACDAADAAELESDGGPADRDAQTEDAGGAAACPAGSVLEVSQDGAALAIAGEEAAARWTALGTREVFRLRFATLHDPAAEAIDDEFRFVIAIDLAPSELLRLNGRVLQIDQRIETERLEGATSYEDDPHVIATPGVDHAPAIRRVLVERQAFGEHDAAARYEITGELSVRLTSSRRAEGYFSLRLRGAVPLGVEDDTDLRIAGCFDLDASHPLACIPGARCAVDCVGEQEWACTDCGQLYFTHACGCLPDLAPLSDCEDASPADAGELCGEQWWCARPCAAGLQCLPDASYGDGDSDADAGAGVECYYRTCRGP